MTEKSDIHIIHLLTLSVLDEQVILQAPIPGLLLLLNSTFGPEKEKYKIKSEEREHCRVKDKLQTEKEMVALLTLRREVDV